MPSPVLGGSVRARVALCLPSQEDFGPTAIIVGLRQADKLVLSVIVQHEGVGLTPLKTFASLNGARWVITSHARGDIGRTWAFDDGIRS